MFHACVQKFDVTENLEKFCKILETKALLEDLCLSCIGTSKKFGSSLLTGSKVFGRLSPPRGI